MTFQACDFYHEDANRDCPPRGERYVPEHTLMAKAIAHAFGSDFLEQDVVASKDGVPVVLHDEQIDTVTDVAKKFPRRHRGDGRFYAIDFTVDELKQLSVSERFDPRSGKAVFAQRYPVGKGDFRIATLDEEITFIKTINRTIGREAGIYPEIKGPAWHREQGFDLSAAVLNVLAQHGYTSKDDPCFLQCFDEAEVKRLREDLRYEGLLIQLIGHGHDEESGTDYKRLKTPEGLADTAKIADGIGPSLDDIVSWSADGQQSLSDLVQQAQQRGLEVHPWTFRADALPKNCPSPDALLAALLRDAQVDGLFCDHPDLALKFLRSAISE